MPTTPPAGARAVLAVALARADSSTRLRAALAAGTTPHPDLVAPLVDRCRTEPDFFVRDMLTWALTRHPVHLTLPALLDELDSPSSQARSQALHTLSKIGDPASWSAISTDLLHHPEAEVARSAWRAAVVLVPPGHEPALAVRLAKALGRGDQDTWLSLSRALVALAARAADDAVVELLEEALVDPDPQVRDHAAATMRLRADPDGEFQVARDEATRIVLTGAAPADAAPTPDPTC